MTRQRQVTGLIVAQLERGRRSVKIPIRETCLFCPWDVTVATDCDIERLHFISRKGNVRDRLFQQLMNLTESLLCMPLETSRVGNRCGDKPPYLFVISLRILVMALSLSLSPPITPTHARTHTHAHTHTQTHTHTPHTHMASQNWSAGNVSYHANSKWTRAATHLASCSC